MGKVLLGFVALVVCLAPYSLFSASEADKNITSTGENGPVYTAPKSPRTAPDTPAFDIDRLDRIEAAVVHPYRSANVGTEVKGVIDRINFEEGDPVLKDAVVLEISPDRYKLMAKKAEERVKGLELSLKNAEDDLKIKEELLSLNAGTQQDVTKARTQVDIEKHRLLEAREELKLAAMDLESCLVRAPFSGFLAVRYKQPDEVVNQYDNVFALVDKSKVYAVANVPESQTGKFVKGAKAIFIHGTGKKYDGAVDKVGVLVDPQSKTLKVHILIDNSSGDLQVGTTGSLELTE
jgi:RND family efflux transporter MFP subunit